MTRLACRAVAGGALSVDSIGNFGNTYVLITQSTFTANSAQGSLSGSDFATLGGLGGALRIFAAVLWIDGADFTQNLAGTVGGAIFFNQSCALVSHGLHELRLARALTLCRTTHDCPTCSSQPVLRQVHVHVQVVQLL